MNAYRLGTRVRFRGNDGMIVARTLCGTPSYDLRLGDGRIVKYVPENELHPLGEADRPEGEARQDG